MASKKDKARKIYEWYLDIKKDTQDWREWRDRYKKAYFGNQWETSVSNRLHDRGQIDVVINYLRPLIRNRVSSMVSQKPTGRVYGCSKEDLVKAEVLNQFLDWHWYNSTGQIHAERVAMSQQREGVGYFVLYEDPKADFGRGELKITSEIWRHVWIPASAGREWDYSDAPHIILSKLLDEDEFYLKNPGYRGKTAELFHPNDEIYWSARREHREEDQIDFPENLQDHNFIRELDTYQRFYKDVRVFYYLATGTVEILDDNYTPNDNENALLKEGIIKELISPVPRIKYSKSYGEKIYVHEEILPISNYPVIPVPDEDTGNAMPLGEIDHNFGVQELMNKCFSILVHNAALVSNPKLVVDAARAAIKDLDQFRNDFTAPGSVTDMSMDAQTGKFPFEIVKPEGLNQAFYTIFERLGQHLQFGTTTFGAKLGDTSNAPDTYSATLQFGEWQETNLKIPLSRLEMGIQRLFDLILEWAPQYYQFQKVFDVVGDNETIEQGIINEERYEQGELVVHNDITKIKAKYRIRLGSTMPAQSVAYMNYFKELAQMNPLFLKHLVEYLPIKEKDKLAKELDLVQQLSSQLKQKDSELNTVAGMLQNSLRQQAEGEVKKKVEKADVAIDKVLAEQDTVLKEMKSEQKMQKKTETKKDEKK